MKYCYQLLFSLLIIAVFSNKKTHSQQILHSFNEKQVCEIQSFDNQIFFSTNDGVFKIHERDTIKIFDKTSFSIAYDEGFLWTANRDYLYRFTTNGKKIEKYKINITNNKKIDARRIDVRKILIHKNKLLLGTLNYGLLEIDYPLNESSINAKQINFNRTTGRSITDVNDIAVHKDIVWLATDNGVCKFKKGKIKFPLFSKKGQPVDKTIYSLYSHGDSLYVGGVNTLWKYNSNNKKWINLFADNQHIAKISGPIKDIAIDNKHNLWIASKNFMKYDGKQFFVNLDEGSVSKVEYLNNEIYYSLDKRNFLVRNTSSISSQDSVLRAGPLSMYPLFHIVFIFDFHSDTTALNIAKTSLHNVIDDIENYSYITITDMERNYQFTIRVTEDNKNSIKKFINTIEINQSNTTYTGFNWANKQLNKTQSVKSKSIVLLTESANTDVNKIETLKECVKNFQTAYKFSVISFANKLNKQEKKLRDIPWVTNSDEKTGNYSQVDASNIDYVILQELRGVSIMDTTGVKTFFGFHLLPLYSKVNQAGNIRIKRPPILMKLGADAMFFFPKLVLFKKIPVGIGVGLNVIFLNNNLHITKLDSVDFQHTDRNNESYTRRVLYKNVEEKQKFTFLELPVFVRFKFLSNKQLNINLDIGGQIALPLRNKYYSKGVYTYQGIYTNYEHEPRTDLDDYGFLSDEPMHKNGTIDRTNLYLSYYIGPSLTYTPKNSPRIMINLGFKFIENFYFNNSIRESYVISEEYDNYNSLIYNKNSFYKTAIGFDLGIYYRIKGKRERHLNENWQYMDDNDSSNPTEQYVMTYFTAKYFSMRYSIKSEITNSSNNLSISNPIIYSSGIEYKYRNKKITYGVGVGYKWFSQIIEAPNYYEKTKELVSDGFDKYKKIIEIKDIKEIHSFKMIELPLSIQYNHGEGEKLSLIFGLGFITSFYTPNLHSYNYTGTFSYSGEYENFEHEIRSNIAELGFLDNQTQSGMVKLNESRLFWSGFGSFGIFWPISKSIIFMPEFIFEIGQHPILESSNEQFLASKELGNYSSITGIVEKNSLLRGGGLKLSIIVSITEFELKW